MAAALNLIDSVISQIDEDEKSLKPEAPLTLKYWNGRGLMEVPRMLLAKAGKTAGTDYTDGRYTSDPPTGNEMALKDVGDLSANMGRMPVVESTAGSVGQSVAINYFVAAET